MTNGNSRPAPRLALRGIHQHFAALQVLKGIDLDVYPGETLGLIGPNGAGKTSLLNVISGLARPDAGQVALAGRDISGLAPEARVRLGMVRCFQSSHVFPEHSVRDNLVLALRARRNSTRQPLARSRVQADALLAQTPLQGLAGAPAGTLSYGQRRLLDLLMALAPDPTLLLLDEPTAGLAQAEARAAMALVRQFCPVSTVLLVTHDIDLVFAQSQRIAVLDQGTLVAVDTVHAIRQSRAAQAAYLGRAQGEVTA